MNPTEEAREPADEEVPLRDVAPRLLARELACRETREVLGLSEGICREQFPLHGVEPVGHHGAPILLTPTWGSKPHSDTPCGATALGPGRCSAGASPTPPGVVLGQEPEPSPTARVHAAEWSRSCRSCTAAPAAGRALDRALTPAGLNGYRVL